MFFDPIKNMLRTDLELEHLKESKTRLDKIINEIKDLQRKIFFQEKNRDKLMFMEQTLNLDLSISSVDKNLNTLNGQLIVLECEKRWFENVLGVIEEKPEFWVGELWK